MGCRAFRTGLAALICVQLLAGCATSGPPSGASVAGLFHADGPSSARLSPGPKGSWYVGRNPQFSQSGYVAWNRDAKGGMRGFFSRLFRSRKPAELTGAIDARADLPLPSYVEVTNLQTGLRAKVRVESRAALGGGKLIQLGSAAASALGADAGQPLFVRVRYAAPVLAYRDRGSLTYARLGRRPPAAVAPAAPRPVELAAAAPDRAAPAAHSAPQPAPQQAPAPSVQLARAVTPPPAAATPAFAVQAGVFAQEDNARRAVARLASTGSAVIEPLTLNGARMYRVVVRRSGDPQLLRARVAQAGFPDAHLRRF